MSASLFTTTWGWKAGERKDVLCDCPPSFSLSVAFTLILSHSLITHTSTHKHGYKRKSPPTRGTHSTREITKWSFEQKEKNGLICFIRLGKQWKKKVINIAQTGMLLIHPCLLTHTHSLTHIYPLKQTYSQKYKSQYLTPFVLVFFVVVIFVLFFLYASANLQVIISNFLIALLFI